MMQGGNGGEGLCPPFLPYEGKEVRAKGDDAEADVPIYLPLSFLSVALAALTAWAASRVVS